jgi:anti-sigma factor RsiW
MTCEEVRAKLPQLAEGGLRAAGAVEEHLAGCAACSAELRRYRALILELAALRDVLLEPPEGLLGRLLAEVPEERRRPFLERVVADERLHRAAFSVGGVVVGASVIGLLWWRTNRRGSGSLEGVPRLAAPATDAASI